MGKIQFIQVEPQELANLINEEIKKELKVIVKDLYPKTEHKEFLTRKETADYFDVSLVCIHDWVNKKILKVYKVGNRSYFKYSELLETVLKSNCA